MRAPVPRQHRTYGELREWTAPDGYGIRSDEPAAGFYRGRLTSGGVRVGIELRFGPPLDPVTGEELDRSHRWLAFVNGEPFPDFDRVWPACAGSPITGSEYRTYCARQEWARQHAPESVWADPHRKRDLLSSQEPLPF